MSVFSNIAIYFCISSNRFINEFINLDLSCSRSVVLDSLSNLFDLRNKLFLFTI